jgi:uncharacterized SAM-binding protein YcdF (DUF218 family)
MTDKEKFLALISSDQIRKSDAIILLEGDGFNRYHKAVELFKDRLAECIVFSGGVVDYSYGSFPYTDILPKLLDAGVPIDKIIHESKSLHTKEQATEVISLAIKNGWKRLILVVSKDHQYRAYLTFLRSVLDVKADIILYNAPVRDVSWFDETGWGKRFDRLTLEDEKIEKYLSLGHLATFTEAIMYQQWKEGQV